jgi:hypothetical protein
MRILIRIATNESYVVIAMRGMPLSLLSLLSLFSLALTLSRSLSLSRARARSLLLLRLLTIRKYLQVELVEQVGQ